LMATLEAQHGERAAQRDESWAAGYACAEQIMLQWFHHERVDPPKGASRGSILRSMIRQAKATSSALKR
jgi:hypothetical protein